MSKYLNYDDYLNKLKIICEILIKNTDKIIPLYKNFESQEDSRCYILTDNFHNPPGRRGKRTIFLIILHFLK